MLRPHTSEPNGNVPRQSATGGAELRQPRLDAIVRKPDGSHDSLLPKFSKSPRPRHAGTGACAFRAYWDTPPHEYSFDYAGDNAYSTCGDGVSDRPVIAKVDEDDVAKVVVTCERLIDIRHADRWKHDCPVVRVEKVESLTKNCHARINDSAMTAS